MVTAGPCCTQGDWFGRPVRLDKVYTSSTTHRQVFREAVYPLVDGLTRGQSSAVVLLGGRYSGKWDLFLGPRHERERGGSRAAPPKGAARVSVLAPGASPAGSPGARFSASPLAGVPGSAAGAASKVSAGSSSGLVGMVLDMLYEHARQVGCASHRFRLACTACEIGEHPQASVSDLLLGAGARQDPHAKGPALVTRQDSTSAPHLDGDPEIGVTVRGLEECVEDFVAPFSAGPVKELLLSRLADAYEDNGGSAQAHFMLTLVLEQLKRPTFQAHNAPKGRNTDRPHFLGLLPYRRAKLNVIVVDDHVCQDSGGAGGKGWPGAVENLVSALEARAGYVPWGACRYTI
jgi:hypothetical protein